MSAAHSLYPPALGPKTYYSPHRHINLLQHDLWQPGRDIYTEVTQLRTYRGCYRNSWVSIGCLANFPAQRRWGRGSARTRTTRPDQIVWAVRQLCRQRLIFTVWRSPKGKGSKSQGSLIRNCKSIAKVLIFPLIFIISCEPYFKWNETLQEVRAWCEP